MSTLTQELADKYLDAGGALCPFCGGPDIEGGSIEIEGQQAWQNVTCNNGGDCEGEWTDTYELVSVGQFDLDTNVEFRKSEPELIGPCNFQFADVAAQLENLNETNEDSSQIELTEAERIEVWDQCRGFLKHCDCISVGNDYIYEQIERFVEGRPRRSADDMEASR